MPSSLNPYEFYSRVKEALSTQLIMRLVILSSFAIPFLILYLLDPNSFQATWKGRTFYLFFTWLVVLEIILTREEQIPNKIVQLKSVRTLGFIVALALPTLYVLAVNFTDLGFTIANLVDVIGIPFAPIPRENWIYGSWLLSLEYLVFAALFVVSVAVAYGKEGLKDYSISALFVAGIGAVYMIDTLYPYGYFSPLQVFVPFTASMAAGVLNLIGYQTAIMGSYQGAPILTVSDSSGVPLRAYAVGWPCAGVQSLLIYTFVMLIFFKRTAIPLLHKAIYFVVGAIITYAVNIFRIVSIYLVYINHLSEGRAAANQAATMFHNYYGGLYSMAWIIAYLLIVIGSRMLWARIKPIFSR